MHTKENQPQQGTNNVSAAWYALYTRPQHEKVVANVLANKGFEVFLPLYAAGHQWKDRTKLLSLPLFSCYVFLRDCLERRLEVLKTPGVHQIVGSCGRPAAIPTDEIDSIRLAVSTSLKLEPHPLLQSGDLVRVKTGPLAGIEGILIRKKNGLRLVMSVEMLGKAVAVEVDGNRVERLGRKEHAQSILRGVSASATFSHSMTGFSRAT
jgi:transcription antitermination factor NusG